MNTRLGKNIVRKEAWTKVTGTAMYTDDLNSQNTLCAKLLTSPHAHAKIISIDTKEAISTPGVKAVITGDDVYFSCGSMIEDMPPLAKGKVRYFGEPIAIVVADDEMIAKDATKKIKIIYEELPVLTSAKESLNPNACIIHENLGNYTKIATDIYPVANTNICNFQKIRKGDIKKGFEDSDIIVESTFKLPQSDHAAMETRVAKCEILPSGNVNIFSSTQAPYSVKEEISKYFGIPEGKITVNVPLVGGGFGGKAAVFLEVLAVIASMAVNGKAVKMRNTREEDFSSAPCHLGLEANIKIGAKKDGTITAAQMSYYVDCGGYAEIAPKMTKAILVDCSGPYNIKNISCDCFTVYTNHTLTTSFRGFGHTSHAFCMERIMDKLAKKLNIDPIKLRLTNALKEGDLTPTCVKVNLSNTGNFTKCLEKLQDIINCEDNSNSTKYEKNKGDSNIIKSTGIGCFYKTTDTPTNAISGVILNFNTDGSININFGAVEIGPGMKTTIAQILSEKMKMNIDKIFVTMDVNTSLDPKHWKTVASMTTFMAGNAVLKAADDIIEQLKNIASQVLRCPPENLDIANEKVYVKCDPDTFLLFKDIAQGYEYQNGNSIGGQIIGRGTYFMNNLNYLDESTGKGKAGLSWTVGAQAVEIEYDKKHHSYRVIKAYTVLDAGKLLNPKTAKGAVMGGMCMGLGLGMSEEFLYDEHAKLLTTSFRTYKMLRYGETPEYIVDFIETPQVDAPYGARGIAEHGIIGIPAALANALSIATDTNIDTLPITPESIWQNINGGDIK